MPENLDRIRELSAPDAITVVDPQFIVGLVEALPDAIVVVNTEGIIVLVNAQCEFLFGYHRSSLIGHPVEQLLPDSLAHRHVGHRQQFFEEPRVRPMGLGQALIGRHRNGSDIEVEINLSPIVTVNGM